MDDEEIELTEDVIHDAVVKLSLARKRLERAIFLGRGEGISPELLGKVYLVSGDILELRQRLEDLEEDILKEV